MSVFTLFGIEYSQYSAFGPHAGVVGVGADVDVSLLVPCCEYVLILQH